jgi:serine/threonine-protein kinase
MSEPEEKGTVIKPGAAQPDGAAEFVGKVLNGTYKVLRFIARGGMGEVYEGAAVLNERDRVAIKIIRRELATDPNIQRMFKEEANTLMRLAHPGLVQYRVFARDENLDVSYIVTEFVDGRTLSAALPSLQVDSQRLIELTKRLASALRAAHELGRYHRDMCPDNVLLPKGDILEQAKIIDFGIAKKTAEGNETFFTTQGAFVGRFGYSAPEQFSEKEIGPWTDIYSLALVILAVAGRKPPNMGHNFWEAVKQRQAVPDLSVLPNELHPLFARMLAPETAHRLRSMDQVLTEIAEIGTIKTAAAPPRGRLATPTARPIPTSAPAPSPRRWLAILGTATVLLLASGGTAAYLLLKSPATTQAKIELPPPPPPPPQPPPPARAEIIQRVDGSLAAMTCRWLTSNYPETGYPAPGRNMSVVLTGVAGGPADITAELQRAAGLPQDRMLEVNASAVWPVQPEACAPLDAFSQFRDMASLTAPSLFVEQPEFVLGQPMACGRGRLKQAEVKFTLKIGEPPADFSLIFLLPDGRMLQLITNRASFDQLRRRAPTIKDVGDNTYTMTLCTDEAAARESPNGRFGLVLLKGTGPFQLGLKSTDYDRVPGDWPTRFADLAKANGWMTEMAWYEVVDNLAPAPGETPSRQ